MTRRFGFVHNHPISIVLALSVGLAPSFGRAEPPVAERHSANARPPDRAPLLPDRLDRRALICAVLERNQSIVAAERAIDAASHGERTPSALGDTMLSYAFAPGSIGGGDGVHFGQVITVEQWFRLGQSRAERRVARAQTEVARSELQALQNQLAQRAAALFAERYAIERALATNHHHEEIRGSLLEVSLAQYEAGKGSQQDPLQAQLALEDLRREKEQLESRRQQIAAELNGLLHRAPNEPLPAAPSELHTGADVPESEALYRRALEKRPELEARQSQVDREQAAVTVARRRFAPDLSVMAQYNSMWPSIRHQFMAGIGLRLPLQVGAIRSDVRQVQAQVAAAKAELAATRDEVLAEVERARRAVEESLAVARLYRERLLPLARQRLDAAQSAYMVGKSDFQAVLEAEQALREVELGLDRTLAELEANRASLDYAVGVMADCDRRGGA